MTSSNTRLILDNLSIAVLLIDRSLKITYVNSACESLISNSIKQVERHPIQEIIEHPNSWQPVISNIDAGNTLIERNTPLVLCHLRREIEADVAMTRTPDGTILIEIQPLNRSNAIARTSEIQHQAEHNRLIIRNLAHEIRNPLAGINGAAQRLRDIPKDQQDKYLDLITGQVSRLNELLKQMTGDGKPKFEMTNIHRIIEDALALMQQNPSCRDIIFKREYDPSLPDVSIDGGQIQQVLINLISNATKAQDYHGEILIKSGVVHQITLGNKRYKSALCIDVIDHGCGVPESLQSAIFQPMISHFNNGSGLGLAIAQNIMHSHGGSLDVKSEPDETTFSMIIPFSRSSK